MKAFSNAQPKYRAVHNLLIDSGLRVVEFMHLVNNWTEPDKVSNFYRSEIGMFRKETYKRIMPIILMPPMICLRT